MRECKCKRLFVSDLLHELSVFVCYNTSKILLYLLLKICPSYFSLEVLHDSSNNVN